VTAASAAPLTVSVVLCTHNGAAFIAEQLASILAQRPAPIEIVLGDDDSRDGTVDIVERLVADARATDPDTAPELVVRRHSPALGVTANFADAIAHARGELIALSDQDDIWMPDKLAVVVDRFAHDSRLTLVHSDARLIDGASSPLGGTLLEALEITTQEKVDLVAGNAQTALLRRNLVTGATVVFRRELLEHALPIPSQWVHDEWLAAVAAGMSQHAGAVRLMPRPLIDYRQHDANQIGARRPSLGDRWARLTEPRDERQPWLAERTRLLAERLRERGAPAARLARAEAKHAHEAARAEYPAARLLRIPAVVGAAVRGHYARYSRGGIDIVRDLLQPATRGGER